MLLGEIDAQALDHVGAHRAELRHGRRDVLDLVLVHHGEQAARTAPRPAPASAIAAFCAPLQAAIVFDFRHAQPFSCAIQPRMIDSSPPDACRPVGDLDAARTRASGPRSARCSPCSRLPGAAAVRGVAGSRRPWPRNAWSTMPAHRPDPARAACQCRRHRRPDRAAGRQRGEPQHHRPQHEQQGEQADHPNNAVCARCMQVGLVQTAVRAIPRGLDRRPVSSVAKRMLTTSTWSPRLSSKPIALSPGWSMRSRSSAGARLPGRLAVGAGLVDAVHHHRQADAVDLRLLADQGADGLADFVVGGLLLPASWVPAAIACRHRRSAGCSAP